MGFSEYRVLKKLEPEIHKDYTRNRVLNERVKMIRKNFNEKKENVALLSENLDPDIRTEYKKDIKIDKDLLNKKIKETLKK